MEKLELYLKKANDNLKVAKELFNKGYKDIAVSRLYYSVFYAIEALLLKENKYFKKHSGVISYFGKEYAKKGKISPEFHRFVINLFELRENADYDPVFDVDDEELLKFFDNADILINLIEKKIKESEK
jgi:uncharacterized protein (UPF0332 family)